MPIRINLLSEIQAEEELRRRDPVKRAAFIGFLLVGLSLVWFSSIWLETKIALKTKTQIDNEIQSHTNEYNRVLVDLKKISDGQRRIKALDQLNTNRFLQGNLLNALQKVYVPNVQISRLRLNQNYAAKEGFTPQTGSVGAPVNHSGSSTEKIVLLIDAMDSSTNPGDQVNRYKDAIGRQGYFKTNLLTNGVKLITLSTPQIHPNGKSFVNFTLECRYPDKTR